jgi:uncharacterized membrane protein YdbT with pleckstrin-like domain
MADRYLSKMLGSNEKIILETRHHWLMLLWQLLPEAVLFIALAVLVSLMRFSWLPDKEWVAWGYALLLLPAISATRDLLMWLMRKFIVTSRRVVQLSGVINKNVTDSSLEKVNDVKLAQPLLGRLFGYGDIEILTASELGVNKFARIKDPVGFKTAMLDAKESLESERGVSS